MTESVKISDLISGGPVLTGAEIVPLVQSGITRRATVDEINAVSKGNVDALMQYGLGTSYTSATILAAVSAIGANNKSLTLQAGIWAISANVTIPANIKLIVSFGALLVIDTGITLTINGPFDAGDYQVFSCSGTGKVVWGSNVHIVNMTWWGLTSDGATNDKAALQAAATSCVDTDITLYLPEWANCAITSQLSLRYVRNLDIRGNLVVGFTGSPGVIVGDLAAHKHTNKKYIASVRDTGETIPADPLIRIVGAKSHDIHIGVCDYVQVYANADTAADKSSAYNQITFGYVLKHELLSEGTDTTGWINENTFKGGRIKYLTINGVGYNHNNNRWEDATLENSTVVLNYGHSNTINGRFETTTDTCTIQFDAGTWGNKVVQDFLSSFGTSGPSPTITDNGVGNVYYRAQNLGRTQKEFFNLSRNTRIYSDTPEIAGSAAVVQAGLEKLTVTASQSVWTSGFIPVSKGMMFRLVSDQKNWRHRVYVYDSARAAITTEPTGQISMAGSAFNASGYYAFAANVTNAGIAISEITTLAYIKIEARSGATPAAFNYLIGYYFPRLHDVDALQDALMKPKIRQISLAAAPTSGFASVGEVVIKTDGTAAYRNIFAIDTTVSEEVSASETEDISVTDLTGVTAGDIVGLLLDDGTTYWDTVADVTGGDLTLTGAGPASAAASGNRIVFNRWISSAW